MTQGTWWNEVWLNEHCGALKPHRPSSADAG
jgi:hypothetical protein